MASILAVAHSRDVNELMNGRGARGIRNPDSEIHKDFLELEF